jgi:hypothetical protein
MNRKLIAGLLISAIGVFSAGGARAELKFKQTEIELHPGVTEAAVVAHFGYENTGEKPIRILSLKSSCGCTAATNNKNEVAPGEKGEIMATFTIGNRVGPQKKVISVETDDQSQPKMVLTLKATIPQLLQIVPAFVYWRQGEAPKPKTFVVRAADEFPVTKLNVASTGPEFRVTMEPSGQAKEFLIRVEPKQTDHAAAATLLVQPDFPKESPKKYFVSARVLSSDGSFYLPPGAAGPVGVLPAARRAPSPAPSPAGSSSPR